MALIKKGVDPKRTGVLPKQDEETKKINTPRKDTDDETRTVSPTPPRKDTDDETRTVSPNPRKEDETRSVEPAHRGESHPDDQANPASSRKTGTRVGLQRISRKDEETRTVDNTQTEQQPDSPPRLAATQQMKGGTEEIQTLSEGSTLQNRYVIEGILGVGGMSVVYRGRDLRFKDVTRHCAVKEMYQHAPDSHTRMLKLRHFEREAGLLATLNHPAIPKVYDFFEEEGRVYLVQEMIPGKDLETILDNHDSPIDQRRAVAWAIQICDVLSYLHNHTPEPIVFRDMKPSNVLVTAEDRVFLIDFGIARLLDPEQRKGTMIGTEGYAPPEQYRGIAEPQGDIYALGATLHHLLSGSDPRVETPFTFQKRSICKPNPTVSPELEAIIFRAVEYEMTARWTTIEEFKQALLKVPGMETIGQAYSAIPGTPLAATRNQQAELLWKFTCEEEVRSSPCISNGLVMVGCYDYNLYAVDAENGKFRWKYATEGGVSSSPCVWQDVVIFGSEDGNVYGVDTRNGSRRWIFRTEKAIHSSPVVQDRVVFIGSDDLHFYALDGLRGVLVWKYRAWMPFRSSAGVGRDTVYVGCDDGHVYCLEIRSSNMKWKQRTQKPIISTPYYSDGLVFVGSLDNTFYALEAQGGMPVWKYRAGHQIYSSPMVVDTRVFVGSADGNMYALERKNGRMVWKYETGSQITSSPCHAKGRIYFGAVDGHIYCIDATDGSLIWKYETDGPVVSSASVWNDVVYIGSMDHHLYALKA
jgi:outer membrane protein assembly factor BamB/tRNA A-37 threonylcarbamoyl transferase component Bud32